jgi:hypothetical protein
MKLLLPFLKFVFLSCFLGGIVTINLNATIVSVPGGSATLSAAVTAATAGDILEIAGDITETGDISFTKSLTIRAASGLSAKPKVTMKRLLLNGADIVVTVDGIEFVGASGAAEFVDVGSAITMKNLKISNCDIHNYTRAFRFTRNMITMDTFLIDKCRFYEEAYTTVTYPVFNFAATNKPVFKSIVIQNSTFYKNGCTFMIVPQAAPAGDSTRISIDHNTFYNNVYQEATTVRYFMIANAAAAVNVRLNISNNIISTLADPTKVLPFLIQNVKAIFNNNLIHNFNGPLNANNVVSLYSNPVVTMAPNNDTITNPEFKDAANADFTLPVGSTLLKAASDGGAIGDPRWVPAVTSVRNLVTEPNIVTNRSGNIEITTDHAIGVIKVTNIKGVQMMVKKVNASNAIISTESWHSGVYIITIGSQNQVYNKKICIIK